MIFDTDVIVWFLRGNEAASDALEVAPRRLISVVTYFEILQGVKDKKELQTIRELMLAAGLEMIDLSPDIGRAGVKWMETYRLSHALDWPDALIAATAISTQEILCTGNQKHFRCIAELKLSLFRP